MQRILRLLVIQYTLVKYGLDEIILATPLFSPIKYVHYLLPWNWFSKQTVPRAVRLRQMLESLGPIYVKLGQLLSTRKDLIPEDIAIELEKLQDKVKPFSSKQAKAIIEKAYNDKLESIFTDFEAEPLASASIAQAHSARLKNGQEVIVKVIRPNIERQIQKDFDLIQLIARQTEKYYPESRIFGFTSIVAELKKTLIHELDLKREAANASQLKRNFIGEKNFYVPQINWEFTTKEVMVIEKIDGVSVSNINALKQLNVDLKWLAEYGIEIFFKQVFRDNFFHADMHPGNIFVSKADDDETKITVVDFGIMGSLTRFDQRYLAENFMAFLNRDYQRVVALHIESGWVPPNTRQDDLEFAIRTVCEPLLSQPIQNTSLGELLQRLFQIAKIFHIEIMPQLILLQKTMINVEGIGRQLYPQLDLWNVARPQIQQWIHQRMSVKELLSETTRQLPNWLEHVPYLPSKIVNLINQLHDGKLQLQNNSKDIERLRQEIRLYNKRTLLTITGSGLMVCAALIYALYQENPAMLAGLPLAVWITTAIAIILLLLASKKL